MCSRRFQRGKLSDFLGKNIVFRELEPIDNSLPRFSDLKEKLGFYRLPRKKDPEYAMALSEIFRAKGDFNKILYIGDTLMSDLSVIKNFADMGKFAVMGIITRENEIEGFEKRDNYIFNGSWANLPRVARYVEDNFFSIDNGTILVVDIDKTAIGARGRNERAIDRARMDAIFMLVENIFPGFSKEQFLSVYSAINNKKFFYLTEDNQDFTSILSILVFSGTVELNALQNFGTLLEVLQNVNVKNPVLMEYVETVMENIKKKNPTAFPQFRKAEFEKTVARMDFLSDDESESKLLEEEILITKEVYDTTLSLKEKGAFVFGVSDKPALSSMPGENEKDLPPIYEKTMKIFRVVHGGKDE
jgi:hypothetical protein